MKNKLIIVALILGSVLFVNAQGKGKDSGDKGGKSEQKGNGHSNNGGNNQSKGNDKSSISIGIQQKGNGNQGHGGNDNHYGKGNSGKDYDGKSNSNHPGNKNDYKNNGNGNAYGHYKNGKSGREFGQARAAAARSKHRHYQLVTIGDGRRFLDITLKRNYVLLSLTQRKLSDFRIRLNGLHAAGTITTVVYEEKVSRIQILEERRAAIEVNINL